MRMSRLLIVGTMACYMTLSPAQSKAQPTQSEAAPNQSATRIFKSAGISAAIAGLTVDRFAVQFQVALKNDRKTPILISPIIMRGSGELAATTTNGVVYAPSEIAGVAPCDGHNVSVAVAISNCMKDFETSAMTRLEPGDIATINVSYRLFSNLKPLKTDDKISTAIKLLVRTAPSDDSTLEAAAKGKIPGPASIVTINFPLVPINAQS